MITFGHQRMNHFTQRKEGWDNAISIYFLFFLSKISHIIIHIICWFWQAVMIIWSISVLKMLFYDLIFSTGLFSWTREVLEIGRSSQAVKYLKYYKWQMGWQLNITTHKKVGGGALQLTRELTNWGDIMNQKTIMFEFQNIAR